MLFEHLVHHVIIPLYLYPVVSSMMFSPPCRASKCGTKMSSHISPAYPAPRPDSHWNDTNTCKPGETTDHDPPSCTFSDISAPQWTYQESTAEGDIEQSVRLTICTSVFSRN